MRKAGAATPSANRIAVPPDATATACLHIWRMTRAH